MRNTAGRREVMVTQRSDKMSVPSVRRERGISLGIRWRFLARGIEYFAAAGYGVTLSHHNAVRGDLCAEACGGFAEVLFGPEFADGGREMGGIPEVFPGDRNFGVGGAAIQQHDGAA
jgi:hypothetical protein